MTCRCSCYQAILQGMGRVCSFWNVVASRLARALQQGMLATSDSSAGLSTFITCLARPFTRASCIQPSSQHSGGKQWLAHFLRRYIVLLPLRWSFFSLTHSLLLIQHYAAQHVLNINALRSFPRSSASTMSCRDDMAGSA